VRLVKEKMSEEVTHRWLYNVLK